MKQNLFVKLEEKISSEKDVLLVKMMV